MFRTSTSALALGIAVVGAFFSGGRPSCRPKHRSPPLPPRLTNNGLANLEDILRHLPFRSQGAGRTESRDAGPRQPRRERRHLGKGVAQAAQPRDAAGRGAAARRRHLQRARRRLSKASAIAWRRSNPIPAARRSIASTAPNTPTPFAICSRSTSTLRSCCRPTTSATDSTISATCCRCRLCCWSAISLRQPARSARHAVGDTELPAVLSDLRRSARAQAGRSHGRRPCRSARAAAPRRATFSRSMANMRSRSSLQRGRADEFLGLGRDRKLDLRLDDQAAQSCSPSPPIGAARADDQHAVGKDPDACSKSASR